MNELAIALHLVAQDRDRLLIFEHCGRDKMQRDVLPEHLIGRKPDHAVPRAGYAPLEQVTPGQPLAVVKRSEWIGFLSRFG